MRVSPARASMVGPGTCPLNPYPRTVAPGLISQSSSAACNSTLWVMPVGIASGGWITVWLRVMAGGMGISYEVNPRHGDGGRE